ncbi:MAG: isoprenyl transferase [Clostridiales bacterium]|nr:isoprenyl transferase [Clostridiales bacterium]
MQIHKLYTKDDLASFGLTGALPAHVGIIMDGNGRWAKKRLMPRSFGHRAGIESLHNIVRECIKLDLKALTVYAFSTENWKRPQQEVNTLFSLFIEFIVKEIDELDANRVRIITLGDLAAFPDRVRICMENASERTKNNTGLTFCLCLNYGGRAEILRAVRNIAASGADPASIDEKLFSDNLYTAGLPELDLVIRTAGEQRLSNFLLWQAAYAEFVFTDTLWPDYKPENLRANIIEFMKRTRRFGKVVE